MMLGADSFHVIYENEELLVLNKPYDVPMDGVGYTTTVEEWALAHRTNRNDLGDKKQVNPTVLMTVTDDTAVVHDDRLASSTGKGENRGMNGKKKMIKFVHQLDFATSGVLCVAFSKDMAARLAHCFEMRTTQKAYLAVLRGTMPVPGRNDFSENGSNFCAQKPYLCSAQVVPLDDLPNARFIHGCIKSFSMCIDHNEYGANGNSRLVVVNLPIGDDTNDPKGFRMVVNGHDARESVTYVYVLQHGYMAHPSTGSAIPVTKALLIPRTGRRHQLRVHCQALGFPILGDVTYAEIPRTQLSVVASQSEMHQPLMPKVLSGAAETIEKVTRNTAGTPVANWGTESGEADDGVWHRMMLHAWRLSFPVSVEPVRCGVERYDQKRRRRRQTLGLDDVVAVDDVETWTQFEARDPFQPTMFVAGQPH